MKRALSFLLWMVAPLAFASIVVIYDPGTGRNLHRIDSADTLRFRGLPGSLINPALPTNRLDLCKVTNNAVVLLSAAELAADSAAIAASVSNAIVADRTARIDAAKSYLLSDTTEAYVIRGMLFTILQRMNQLSTSPSTAFPNVSTNAMWLAISNSIVLDPR